MTKHLKFLSSCLLLIVLLSTSGCGKNDAQKAVNEFMNKTRSDIPAPKKPMPIPAEDFTTKFQTVVTRDPFSSLDTFVSKKYSNAILQQYTLESLRLIGILEKHKKKWAIFTAPDEKIYRVAIGTRIGKQQSLITKIVGNSVFLETDQFPGNLKKESVLVLQKN